MNRQLAPEINLIDSITFPNVEQLKLDNGVPVYLLNEGVQDVVKIELMFKAGKWFESKNLIADFTNRMLREGTKNYSAKQIADTFDYYGANFNTSSGFETAGASLFSLTKHIDLLLPVFAEIFTESVFPENELNTILSNRTQRLSVDLKKNDFLANRDFLNALFGKNHPYGRVSEFEHFENIFVDDLKAFYKSYYSATNLTILVAGKFSPSLVEQLNKYFGSKNLLRDVPAAPIDYAIESSAERIHHTEKSDSVQSAIIIGNMSINKTHPDFLKLSVLNTVFGGYFGSRLMSNIREEKGYTYGIYSSFASYPHAGFIEIASEVGKDVRDATLKEIQHEINVLRTELIDEEELQVVKNYMSGKILRSIDGPLKFSETLKGLLIYNQDVSYIDQLLKTVREVTSDELLQLAQKYFDYDKMYKVTVG
ncbi:MAG: pitrilysin family protein [Bacteroidetes bacterium]|nr:pitrilysin family protein [Bacteroidota bacterium]